MTALAKIIERSHRDRESWRYTDVQKILSGGKDIQPQKRRANGLKLDVGTQFVFVDGVLDLPKSHFGDLPKDILTGDAKDGYRLKLEGQTCLVTQPVEFHFVGDASGEVVTKLSVELGANGRMTLIERHASAASLHLMETDITLHPQSKLIHGKAVKNGATASHIAFSKVHAAVGAFYDNFALVTGGRLTRNEIEVALEGKLAQCALNGAMLLRGYQHADTTTRITHKAPDCSSRQVYKSVLAEKSRGVFQGKIIVAEGAQKTDGYQMSRALLLSDQAEMSAKPELEIYADDVKCSHGSTVGDLDTDALFYLRSRGLSEEAARGLLIRAFVEEIVDEIRVTEWRDFCRAEVEGWLDEQG